MASTQVNLYEAKTQLSRLVERAAQGEEILIAKAGKPMARLTALPPAEPEEEDVFLRNFGKNILGVVYLSPDWEEDLPWEDFESSDEDELYKRSLG